MGEGSPSWKMEVITVSCTVYGVYVSWGWVIVVNALTAALIGASIKNLLDRLEL